jgi:hypothetical protein
MSTRTARRRGSGGTRGEACGGVGMMGKANGSIRSDQLVFDCLAADAITYADALMAVGGRR